MSQDCNHSTPTRVIAVQGPLQLVTAMAVLRFQQETEGLAGFRDLLLIGELSALEQPREEMYKACTEIQKAWPFAGVLDLTALEAHKAAPTGNDSIQVNLLDLTIKAISRLRRALTRIPFIWRLKRVLDPPQQFLVNIQQQRLFPNSVERLRRLVCPSCVRYVYTCRNTQFINELTLCAFEDSVRICYGDGLGAFALNNSYGAPTFNPGGFLPMHRACLIAPLESDPGSLDLIRLTVVPYRFFVEIVSAILDSCEEVREKATEFLALSNGRPITLATTGYLAELGLVESAEAEVELYQRLILPHIASGELVLIKGHPREGHGQSRLLAERLRHSGFSCEVMSNAAQLPIELFAPLLPIHKLVTYYSSAFVGMLILRQCPVVVGLGRAAYRDTLKLGDSIDPIRHEQMMILLAQQVFSKSIRPIRMRDQQWAEIEVPEVPTLICPTSLEDTGVRAERDIARLLPRSES